MKGSEIILALGGGGARGVTHLGVIEVLLKAGLTVDRVVGVSIGSLAGAMYAFDPDIARVQGKALRYLLSPKFQQHQETLFGSRASGDNKESGSMFGWYERVKTYLYANRMFRRVILSPSMLPAIVLQDVVENLLPDADISDSVIPLSIVAVDLKSGHMVVLEKGPLRDAVRASAALPGIFPPIRINGMLLCDVGVFYSLPTTVARTYAPNKCLVAVDVSSGLHTIDDCQTAFDVLMRMDEIGETLFRKHVRSEADVVICPDVAGVEWFDFSSPHKLMEIGREAGEHALPQIRAALSVAGRNHK